MLTLDWPNGVSLEDIQPWATYDGTHSFTTGPPAEKRKTDNTIVLMLFVQVQLHDSIANHRRSWPPFCLGGPYLLNLFRFFKFLSYNLGGFAYF